MFDRDWGCTVRSSLNSVSVGAGSLAIAVVQSIRHRLMLRYREREGCLSDAETTHQLLQPCRLLFQVRARAQG
jgi:hypothetical protein